MTRIVQLVLLFQEWPSVQLLETLILSELNVTVSLNTGAALLLSEWSLLQIVSSWRFATHYLGASLLAKKFTFQLLVNLNRLHNWTLLVSYILITFTSQCVFSVNYAAYSWLRNWRQHRRRRRRMQTYSTAWTSASLKLASLLPCAWRLFNSLYLLTHL